MTALAEASTWSPQQEAAIKAVRAWHRDRSAPQVFRLFGYAGTGKTTLAKHLADGIKGRILYGAFTGKAALVLQDGSGTCRRLPPIKVISRSFGAWPSTMGRHWCGEWRAKRAHPATAETEADGG